MAIKKANKIFGYLYKFHIYGGLFSSAFFIIIGLTSLNYNHPGFFRKEKFRERVYYRPFSLVSDRNEVIIEHATDTLGIFGHRPWWLQRRDKENNLHFQVNRPGKQYFIVALQKEKQLKVTERPMGIIHALSGMHVASGGFPGSALFTVWAVYAHGAVIAGLISIVLSFYFWIKKSKLGKWQWFSAGAIFVVSVLYIMFIWLVG